jgi:peptidoglycan/LPS O-acetylase OafA/YrhL
VQSRARTTSRSAGIDVLRAVAALMVFAYHAHALYRVVLPGPLAQIGFAGNRGVTIFFVISGFVLYGPMLARLPNLRAYAIRRVSRIYPAYVVAVVGTALLLGIAFQPAYLGFLETMHLDDPTALMRVAWTLQAEVIYYAALPVVAWLLLRARWPTVALAVAALLATAASIVIPAPQLVGPWTAAWHAWAFLLGMLVARLPVRWPVVLTVLGAIGIYASLWTDGYVATGYAAALLVAGLRAVPAPRLLALAGASLSYAFYLWHWPALMLAGSARWGLALAIVFAAISWFLVERPILELVRRRSVPVSLDPSPSPPGLGSPEGVPAPFRASSPD